MLRNWIISLTSLLLFIGSVAAQPATWSAWMYDQPSGRMIRVDETGLVLEDFILPTVIGHTSYSFGISVSHTGSLIAYTVHNPDMQVTQLLVYDTVTDTLIATYSPGRIQGDTMDIAPGKQMFNTLDNILAYGYIAEDGGWDLVLLNLLTGNVSLTLSHDDPSLLASGVNINPFMLPTIQRYEGSAVYFTMTPYASEGQMISDNYKWDLLTNLVSASQIYPTANADTLPATGEVVLPTLDDRLPNRLDTLEYPFQWNALHVYEPASGARFPFIANEAWSFGPAFFVEGGNRILAQAYQIDSALTQWLLIQRDGIVAGFAPIAPSDFSSVRGTNDGFVYSANTSNAGGELAALLHVDTRQPLHTGNIIWTAPAGILPQLVWAHDVRDDSVVAPLFMPWQQVAPPILSGEAGIAPGDVATPTPLAGGSILTIGGVATINTTQGDNLNMRSGPGTSFEIVAKVTNGTRVTLVEGPRNANTYVWWRIRLINGIEGWVVEFADDVPTLIPSR